MKEDCEPLVERSAKAIAGLIAERRVLVTAHRNADPDALSSSLVFYRLAAWLGGKTIYSLPEGVSHASKRLAQSLGVDLGALLTEPSSIDWDAVEVVAVLDTASIEQLGVFSEHIGAKKLVVVDHHASSTLARQADIAIYDPAAKATAELVYMLSSCLGYPLQGVEAGLLLAGIVYDTKRFILASPRVLRVAASLLVKGASMDAVLAAFQPEPMDVSERIARLKAAQRMKVLRAGEVLVAVTRVSAFEASAARGILDLGADIAVVISPQGPKTRVVARAKKNVVEKLGISLGKDLMERLGKEYGGSGGGHDVAAAALINTNPDEALLAATRILRELFKSRGTSLETLL